MCLIRSCAVSDADGNLVSGMKCTALENLSTMVMDGGVVVGGGEPCDKVECNV